MRDFDTNSTLLTTYDPNDSNYYLHINKLNLKAERRGERELVIKQ